MHGCRIGIPRHLAVQPRIEPRVELGHFGHETRPVDHDARRQAAAEHRENLGAHDARIRACTFEHRARLINGAAARQAGELPHGAFDVSRIFTAIGGKLARTFLESPEVVQRDTALPQPRRGRRVERRQAIETGHRLGDVAGGKVRLRLVDDGLRVLGAGRQGHEEDRQAGRSGSTGAEVGQATSLYQSLPVAAALQLPAARRVLVGMNVITDLVALLLSAVAAVIGPSTHDLERRVERSFEVAPGSLASVAISGGSISVSTVPGRTARLVLIQRVDASSEREADAALEHYEVALGQTGDRVHLAMRRKPGRWTSRERNRVRMSAELGVPADVRLDLDTSGGSIVVHGDRTAAVAADTSGGSITVDGGAGVLDLDTSGGSIRVGRVLTALHAGTSGGSISVSQVGRTARDVLVDTSGGSIRVGVSPAARLNVEASTSGGGVSTSGLPLTMARRERSALAAVLNDGGGRLRATTSGGSVSIYAAAE